MQQPQRSVSVQSRPPVPESAPAAPKGWMQSVTDCIGDLCKRKSKTKPPPSSAFHESVAPVRRSTMESPKHIITQGEAAKQKRAENAAQKELEKEQARLNEARTNLTEEQEILDAKKRKFDEEQKKFEDEISRLDKSASEKFKSNGETHFGVQPCGNCDGKHQTRNCPLFTEPKVFMQVQQKAFEDRQGELDAKRSSLEAQQKAFDKRLNSMRVRLPNPWFDQPHLHQAGGAKTKRRHSKTKRSKSKSKKGKKSHRRHH
jgi:hypothetical protein